MEAALTPAAPAPAFLRNARRVTLGLSRCEFGGEVSSFGRDMCNLADENGDDRIRMLLRHRSPLNSDQRRDTVARLQRVIALSRNLLQASGSRAALSRVGKTSWDQTGTRRFGSSLQCARAG